MKFTFYTKFDIKKLDSLSESSCSKLPLIVIRSICDFLPLLGMPAAPPPPPPDDGMMETYSPGNSDSEDEEDKKKKQEDLG